MAISFDIDSLKGRSEKREIKRIKISNGDNILRFLPPIGPNHQNKTFRRWVLCWIMTPNSGGKSVPVVDPSCWTGKKESPFYDFLNAAKIHIDKFTAESIQRGIPVANVEEALKPINKYLQDIKPKTSFFYNAVTKSGEVGVAELKSTAHDELCKAMLRYITDYNQDPCSVLSDSEESGVWFNINREGSNRDTVYKANIAQRKIKNGAKFTYEDDQEPLPENIVQNYLNMGYDLDSLYTKNDYATCKDILMFTLKEITSRTEFALLAYVPGFEVVENQNQPALNLISNTPVVRTPEICSAEDLPDIDM